MSVQSVSVGERLLRPGNNRYEQDRRVWNAMVDHRPGAILSCHSADGVVTLGFVWVGDLPTGFEYASSLSLLGRLTNWRIRTSSYLHLQQQDDDVQGHAVRRYFNGHYFRELPDAALEVFLTPGALVWAWTPSPAGCT